MDLISATTKPKTTARTAKICSRISTKIGLPNYSSIEISKSIECEVTFSTPAELEAKSKGLDETVIALLKAESELAKAKLIA